MFNFFNITNPKRTFRAICVLISLGIVYLFPVHTQQRPSAVMRPPVSMFLQERWTVRLWPPAPHVSQLCSYGHLQHGCKTQYSTDQICKNYSVSDNLYVFLFTSQQPWPKTDLPQPQHLSMYQLSIQIPRFIGIVCRKKWLPNLTEISCPCTKSAWRQSNENESTIVRFTVMVANIKNARTLRKPH